MHATPTVSVVIIGRNEGQRLSSELILEAEALAWSKWPGERFYTYVDPRKIKSKNPGFCFLKAGWRKCGITKVNKLLILEKLPPTKSNAPKPFSPPAPTA